MGWSMGYDERWARDIGYGVIAFCDHPGCTEVIDRGLVHVCAGQEPRGGEGCGLYFCEKHHNGYITTDEADEDADVTYGACARCMAALPPFLAKPEHPDWILWKLVEPSWAEWRGTDDGRQFIREHCPTLLSRVWRLLRAAWFRVTRTEPAVSCS